MMNLRALPSRMGLLLSFFLILLLPAALAEDSNEYRFMDKDGNAVNFPSEVHLYWKEKPGPWRGLQTAHDVTIKTRTRTEGLESSRIINIRLSHKNTDGDITAIYVLDKDSYVVGYAHFKENSGPDIETEIEITSVINYVEICVLCSKHGMWKKVYRFI